MARVLQEMPENIWTCFFLTFAISNTQTLLLIQGWEQGKQSHYIQPSNISSALVLAMRHQNCVLTPTIKQIITVLWVR